MNVRFCKKLFVRLLRWSWSFSVMYYVVYNFYIYALRGISLWFYFIWLLYWGSDSFIEWFGEYSFFYFFFWNSLKLHVELILFPSYILGGIHLRISLALKVFLFFLCVNNFNLILNFFNRYGVKLYICFWVSVGNLCCLRKLPISSELSNLLACSCSLYFLTILLIPILSLVMPLFSFLVLIISIFPYFSWSVCPEVNQFY